MVKTTNNSAKVLVTSPNVRYYDHVIEADYEYENVKCKKDDKTGVVKVSQFTSIFIFRNNLTFHLKRLIQSKLWSHSEPKTKYQKLV